MYFCKCVFVWACEYRTYHRAVMVVSRSPADGDCAMLRVSDLKEDRRVRTV